MLYAELAGLPGAETLHKPKALMRLFAAGPPRVCPASPVAPAPAPRPAARFPAPAAAHPAKFGPARAPSAPPAPGGPFPRAPPPRPPRGPCAPEVGLARRPAVFAPCPASPPYGLPPLPTGLPPMLCLPLRPPLPAPWFRARAANARGPQPADRPLPRAPRPPAVPASSPKGGSNLCERFPGDRRALSREFSRNCRPGVLLPKHRKRARVGTLCQ